MTGCSLTVGSSTPFWIDWGCRGGLPPGRPIHRTRVSCWLVQRRSHSYAEIDDSIGTVSPMRLPRLPRRPRPRPGTRHHLLRSLWLLRHANQRALRPLARGRGLRDEAAPPAGGLEGDDGDTMPRQRDPPIGSRFGRLEVIGPADPSPAGKKRWRCVCDCGQERIVSQSNLVTGNTTSCGCWKKETAAQNAQITRRHGESQQRPTEYEIWLGIKARCYRTTDPAYPRYGGRGIRVCERWLNSYGAFLRDMGRRPSGDHTIDRIDNDRDYTPENCRWATWNEQNRNRRSNRLLTIDGDTRTMAEWCELVGLNPKVLQWRLRAGWDVKDAVLRSVRPKRRSGHGTDQDRVHRE